MANLKTDAGVSLGEKGGKRLESWGVFSTPYRLQSPVMLDPKLIKTQNEMRLAVSTRLAQFEDCLHTKIS